MEFSYDYCPRHREQCVIRVKSNVTQVSDIQVCQKDFDTREDMYAHIYSHYVSHYALREINGKSCVQELEFQQDLYFHWYKEYYTPPSQIALKPITPHRNTLRPGNDSFHEIVPVISAMVDKVIYDSMGMVNRKVVGGLEALCQQRTSINFILTKKVTVGGKEYPLCYYATNDISIPKQLRLLKEFSFDAAQRGPVFSSVQPMISSALSYVFHNLKTKSYYNHFVFSYSPSSLVDMVKLGTSGGILNTKVASLHDKNTKILVVNYGKKVHLLEAAGREVHKIVGMLATETQIEIIVDTFLPLNVTKWKRELRLLHEKRFTDLWVSLSRAREFFIPSLTLTLLSELLHKDRMLIERGAMIAIGCTAWHGGWYQIAKYMNYDNPELFWVDGDITALDKHITDWQLYLYLAAGARYYNWKGMNAEQRRLLKRLYLLLMYHVTNKITLQPGTIWRLIRGVMYSGGKETSHGDSWIMALIFFLYVEYIKLRYPFAAPFIHRCVIAGFIAIIVYGDDHIWCAPKKLRGLMGANSFAIFLKDFLGMELRDYKEYDSFLSEINPNTGTITRYGPKFLKRYFVANFLSADSAPVIPFKPYIESLIRLCAVSEEEGILGSILKAVGQAWDSMGTNLVTYEACRVVYNYASTLTKKTPIEIFREWLVDPAKCDYIRNIIKKSKMTAEEIFESFPPLELLQSRHKLDYPKINNHVPVFRMRDFSAMF